MANIHTLNKHVNRRLVIPIATQGDINGAWEQVFLDGDRVEYLLNVGTIGSDTIDLKLTQATSSGGAGAKDITDAAITQMAAATDDDLIRTIDIGPGALDDVNDYIYVRAEVLVGGSGTEPYGVTRNAYRLRTPGVTAQHATYDEQIEVR